MSKTPIKNGRAVGLTQLRRMLKSLNSLISRVDRLNDELSDASMSGISYAGIKSAIRDVKKAITKAEGGKP